MCIEESHFDRINHKYSHLQVCDVQCQSPLLIGLANDDFMIIINRKWCYKGGNAQGGKTQRYTIVVSISDS